jgi:hypothetical protein
LVALHDKVADVLTPVALLAGLGDAGADGGCAAAAVLKDQIEPVVEPAAFFATICQK